MLLYKKLKTYNWKELGLHSLEMADMIVLVSWCSSLLKILIKTHYSRLFCTVLYLLNPEFRDKKSAFSVGCWEIDGNNILSLQCFYICWIQVSSSSKMEVFAAKTLLLNLAWEHGLEIHTFTTDRSSDLKSLLRWLSVSCI